MKNSKKTILISILTLMILPFFLIPRASVAQEWTYNGADTERIPGFSVYPSEWYVVSIEYLGTPLNHTIMEIVKANISDTFRGQPTGTVGTLITASMAEWNITTDEILWKLKNYEAIYWNGSAYATTGGAVVPIDEGTGTVTASILGYIKYFLNTMYTMEFGHPFEYNATYPNSYSIAFWNSTDNNNYAKINITEDGILQKVWYSDMEIDFPGMGASFQNMTLYSRPAQLPPQFSFTTDTGSLTLDSTVVKLNITITDADNNNDGETDTDYLYRIQNVTTWSDWATPPSQIDWDLGDVAAGSYDITIEVKNMYGVTQKDITIQYSPSEDGDGDGIIPGYPITLISFAAIFGISIIILRYRKKLRL